MAQCIKEKITIPRLFARSIKKRGLEELAEAVAEVATAEKESLR
jgi:hypothetical protein